MNINTTKIDDNQYQYDIMDEWMTNYVNISYWAERVGDDEWLILDEGGAEYRVVPFIDIESALEDIETLRAEALTVGD